MNLLFRSRPKGIIIFFLFLFLGLPGGIAQESNDKKVYVDSRGVMRWTQSDEEVKGFGVNYSVPFAHAYRSGKKLGIDLKEAIRNDVYHFSRLGFDLYRVHVWDTEISDERGNLLKNQHLDLFDFLIKELKTRDINFVITPIGYWGNGWPEPDEDTPGFSDKFGKEKSLTDPEAMKAQQNYLAQFLEHINPYTGIAYKVDPHLLAFEISNEPHHKGTPEEVREFINSMVSSMRSTGTAKPIFYNVSHSIHLAEAYASTEISGGTFQWYPTGLGFGKELEGNLLPNVSSYDIPFDQTWRDNGLAKLVYEFDAADVMKSYIYPAMARSLREAGIQLATHFAYDPSYMAAYNTEYDTHYMNLAYTPSKALALMISGEIFRNLPMYSNLGRYPKNLSFADYKINYEKDLAEMNSERKFIYTGSTGSIPKNQRKLELVAGVGSSPVVDYEGKGAYFLDKLEQGVWRLEVMPDAISVQDPFGNNSLEKTLTVINHAERKMVIDLPDLGPEFSVEKLNKKGEPVKKVSQGVFHLTPGTYILTATGRTPKASYFDWSGEIAAFVAPQTTVEGTYLIHEALPSLTENGKHEISATVVSDQKIEQVEAWLQNGNTYEAVALEHVDPYTFSAQLPETLLENGLLKYRIIVSTSAGTYTFPEGKEGDPGQWNFVPGNPYTTRIVKANAPVYLFNASEDSQSITGKWLPTINTVPTATPGIDEYRVYVEELFEIDPENRNGSPVYDYSFRYNFQNRVQGRREVLKSSRELVFKGQALNNKSVKLQVALVMDNGRSFGKIIALTPGVEEYRIPLSELHPVKTVTLPRPYPTFLPMYFDHDIQEPFNLTDAESLQFSIGPGLSDSEKKDAHGVGIISVRLE